MLREVKEAHSNVEKLSTWKHNIFDNYEVQLTEEDITSNILIKETIVDGQGYVYRVQDEGINQEGSTTIKKIQMEVAVDQSGILLGYDFVLYEHSGGGFRDDTVKYLDSLIGTNLNDLVDTIAGPTPDGVTAMYSRILVHNILVHIKEDLS